MPQVQSAGATISYTTVGTGPPLLLVHGGFLGQEVTWSAVRAPLARLFTVHAMARRGRGESSKSRGHSIADEAADIVSVIDAIGGNTSVIAHSHGALCALEAAMHSQAIERLILYEPPKPSGMPRGLLASFEEAAARGDWGSIVEMFWRDGLQLSPPVIGALKQSPIWDTSVADAEASMEDWRAMMHYAYEPERFRALRVPVLLLTGSESPDGLWQTGDLKAVLPDARVAQLEGQGHAAMLTAPDAFVGEVESFLLGR